MPPALGPHDHPPQVRRREENRATQISRKDAAFAAKLQAASAVLSDTTAADADKGSKEEQEAAEAARKEEEETRKRKGDGNGPIDIDYDALMMQAPNVTFQSTEADVAALMPGALPRAAAVASRVYTARAAVAARGATVTSSS